MCFFSVDTEILLNLNNCLIHGNLHWGGNTIGSAALVVVLFCAYWRDLCTHWSYTQHISIDLICSINILVFRRYPSLVIIFKLLCCILYMCTMLFSAKLVCVQFMYSTSLEGQARQFKLS